MHHIYLAILFFCIPLVSTSQWSVDTGKVTRQCSAIRELVYQAINHQFIGITENEQRTSFGQQTLGTWKFSTTRYNVSFQWSDATTCYVEHNQESTDSFKNDTWQYIAEYRDVQRAIDAEKLYRQLNSQIEGCKFPVDDSTEVNFIPLPIDKLPAERPAALEVASVYELPVFSVTQTESPPVNVMVGMERRQQKYRISLIVEYRRNIVFQSQ